MASPRSAARLGSYRRRASVDHPDCILRDVGTSALHLLHQRTHSHRTPQSFAVRLEDPHPGVLYIPNKATGEIQRDAGVNAVALNAAYGTAKTQGLAIRFTGSSGLRLFEHTHAGQTPKRK